MDRILRAREVSDVTGLSRTTIWKLSRAGLFPRKVKLTTRAIGWRASEVSAWVAAKPKEPARRPNLLRDAKAMSIRNQT
jgi:prophage regulatory protein